MTEKRAGVWPSVLLVVHSCLVVCIALRHSPVIDEVAHLPAGLSHWQFGRFELFRVNPPLVRIVGALPVIAVGAEVDWDQFTDRPGARSEFDVGRDFMLANGERSFWYFTLARWACVPFSLLGGYVCWRWAADLYGPASGVLALTLWSFSPSILANAGLITPDLGATALGVCAGYVFWRWFKQPDRHGTVPAGVALGAALLTKFTWIILIALWPALWLISRVTDNAQRSERDRVADFTRLAAVLLVGLLVVNLGYGFSGTFTRLGDFQFVSEKLAGPRETWPESNWGNRFGDSPLGSVPVPLPKDYVLGLDVVKQAFESNRQSYLGGEFKNGGWWYYYLYALAVKEPLGTWLLLGLACWLSLMRSGYAARGPDTLVLFAPAVVVLVVASVNQGIIQFRYVLPVLPFAFIWISQVARSLSLRQHGVASVAALSLTWSVGSSLWVYPHSGSYFNELAGGPKNGHAHLLSSAIDWGQDLLYLKRWLDKHPEAQPLGLAYYGGFDPQVAGINYHLPPKGPLERWDVSAENTDRYGPHPGWYAVSVHVLRGSYAPVSDGKGGRETLPFGAYRHFLQFQPTAMAGYSIYIYHVTSDEANRVRAELGLPPLPADHVGLREAEQ